MRRGILGGTFDPPHMAHLAAGEAAYRQLDLDVVTIVPAGAPWQKADRRLSAPDHRWRMTQLAIDGVEYFEADDRELRRDGWTYSIDTVESFDPNDELVLILGADSARGFRTWKRWSDVLEAVEVAVAPRPGVPEGHVDKAIPSITWLDMPLLHISGSEIRERVGTGKSVRFLTPDLVWSYFSENHLYEALASREAP